MNKRLWINRTTLFIKTLFILAWLAPLYAFLVQIAPNFNSFISIPILMIWLEITLVIALSILPAIGCTLALATYGKKTIFISLFICMLVFIMPIDILDVATNQIGISTASWYGNLILLLLKLFPLMVILLFVLISTIDTSFFMLSSYSQVSVWQLVWKYFLPLLTPGIWVLIAFIYSLAPSIYAQLIFTAKEQLIYTHILFSIPFILLVYKLKQYK